MNQEFLKSMSDTNKAMDSLHETLEQNDKRNRDIIAEQFTELSKITISNSEKKILNFFWHTIDQTVIKSIKFDALLFCMERKEKNYKHKYITGELKQILLSLNMKKIIEREYNKDIKLTSDGVEFVILNNPKYSQLHLAYKDFIKNKIAVGVTIISLLASLLSIYQWWNLSNEIKEKTPNKTLERNSLP